MHRGATSHEDRVLTLASLQMDVLLCSTSTSGSFCWGSLGGLPPPTRKASSSGTGLPGGPPAATTQPSASVAQGVRWGPLLSAIFPLRSTTKHLCMLLTSTLPEVCMDGLASILLCAWPRPDHRGRSAQCGEETAWQVCGKGTGPGAGAVRTGR